MRSNDHGAVVLLGVNLSGQLGLDDTTNRLSATLVPRFSYIHVWPRKAAWTKVTCRSRPMLVSACPG